MKLHQLITLLTSAISIHVNAQNNVNVLKSIQTEVSSNSKAYELLKDATENIGHRATGTENGKKAEELAANILKSYGYNVDFQEFKFKGWERESLSFKVEGKQFKAVALAHSPADVKISGEMIDLGNGLESDYLRLGSQVKNKIVFASLGLIEGTNKEVKNLHRSEKTALAIKYGAKGIVLFNQAQGNILLTGTASVTGEIITIPAINITFENGIELKNKLHGNVSLSAEINMENKVEEVTGRNILAQLKGSELSDQKIILGGHLDSWDLATGAIDNGVGSFSIIDIARTYKALDLPNKRTIEFVLFMGEEVGLLGSKHYVEEAIKDGSFKEIVAMSNMDMTIDPKVYFSSMDNGLDFLNQISKDVNSYIPDFKTSSIKSIGLHSDHQPFMLRGIPIIGLAQSQFKKGALNCYHANCDELSFVDEQGLKNNVLLQTYLMYRLSNDKELPVSVWNEEEIIENLKSANLEIPLRISGEWRWK